MGEEVEEMRRTEKECIRKIRQRKYREDFILMPWV
jgi:hypothetical protein